MSVIAWDGNCIAADKRIVNEYTVFTGNKLVEVMRESTRYIVGWVGMRSQGLLLLQWFQQGEHIEDWPKCQTKEEWTRFVVLNTRERQIYSYEYYPSALPLSPENKFMAWGSGGEFAIGAMAMGASAVEAVEIASRFSRECGNGVDVFEVNKEIHNGSSFKCDFFHKGPSPYTGY